MAGSIHTVWDLLSVHTPSIAGEIYFYVRHCLIGHPGVRLADIRYVYSHPQALAQCAAFLLNLEDLDPENILEEYDTAGAVALIKENNKKERAAIASSEAARLHEMEVLAADIQTHERNYTRFLVLGPQLPDAVSTKTTLVCTLDHTGASLPDLIAAFASRQIPLYKIESRKLEDDPWAYRFYVECRGDAQDASVAQALQEIQLIVRDFNLVGSYPAAPLLP